MGCRGRLHDQDAARRLSAEKRGEGVDRIFAALADPKRRRAVELLGQRPHSAGELAGALGLAPPAMSRHLRALKEGGLVEDGFPLFDARVRIYRLKDGATAELKQWLTDTEALWSDQLAAFKAHVERGT
jgi:DNA-binding transcriptional ArsR family regulator